PRSALAHRPRKISAQRAVRVGGGGLPVARRNARNQRGDGAPVDAGQRQRVEWTGELLQSALHLLEALRPPRALIGNEVAGHKCREGLGRLSSAHVLIGNRITSEAYLCKEILGPGASGADVEQRGRAQRHAPALSRRDRIGPPKSARRPRAGAVRSRRARHPRKSCPSCPAAAPAPWRQSLSASRDVLQLGRSWARSPCALLPSLATAIRGMASCVSSLQALACSCTLLRRLYPNRSESRRWPLKVPPARPG